MCREWLVNLLGGVMPPPPDVGKFCVDVLDITIPTIKMSRPNYIYQLFQDGVVPLGDPFDNDVFLASKMQLDIIAPYLVYPAELYIEQIWDCEDYAMRSSSDASLFYKVNAIRVVFGDTDYGYHCFLATKDRDDMKLWLLEPNAGFPWAGYWFLPNQEEQGHYIPRKVLL